MKKIHSYGFALLLFAMLAFGLFLGRHPVPERNIQAAASDRSGRLILATGYVAPDVEAVYCLDQLTGRLSAGVLSKKEGKFQGLYERNINSDLAEVLRLKNVTMPLSVAPQYTMVTGEVSTESQGASLWQVAKSVVYIAEVNTGMLLVYTIPWQRSLHGGDQSDTALLELWTAEQFQPGILK
ncbi:MAG: hypothetical protein FWC43_06050 [Planctomycetaceae bacterium]|nr:hypothetical protein [Planctomycetaceae bacterium]